MRFEQPSKRNAAAGVDSESATKTPERVQSYLLRAILGATPVQHPDDQKTIPGNYVTRAFFRRDKDDPVHGPIYWKSQFWNEKEPKTSIYRTDIIDSSRVTLELPQSLFDDLSRSINAKSYDQDAILAVALFDLCEMNKADVEFGYIESKDPVGGRFKREGWYISIREDAYRKLAAEALDYLADPHRAAKALDYLSKEVYLDALKNSDSDLSRMMCNLIAGAGLEAKAMKSLTDRANGHENHEMAAILQKHKDDTIQRRTGRVRRMFRGILPMDPADDDARQFYQ